MRPKHGGIENFTYSEPKNCVPCWLRYQVQVRCCSKYVFEMNLELLRQLASFLVTPGKRTLRKLIICQLVEQLHVSVNISAVSLTPCHGPLSFSKFHFTIILRPFSSRYPTWSCRYLDYVLTCIIAFSMRATCSVLLIRFFSVSILIVGLYRHFAYVGLPVPAGSH